MLEFNTTSNQIERAKELYQFQILNNSISKGKGNIIGALGEIIVFDYYTKKGVEIIHAQNYDYDFLINGFRVECKTLASNFAPDLNYNCHLSAFNDRQKCEYYCFLQALNDYSKVWIKGMIRKEQFNQLKTLKRKGELDGNFTFRENTWIIKNHQLTKI